MSDAGVLLKRPPRWLILSLFWTGRIVQTEGGEEEKQRTTAKKNRRARGWKYSLSDCDAPPPCYTCYKVL